MKKTAVLALFSGVLALFCTACDDGSEYYQEDIYWEEPTNTFTETTEETTTFATLSSEEISSLLSSETEAAEEATVQTDVTETTIVSDSAAQPGQQGQGAFGTAIYLAKSDDDSERFFLFYDNGSGAYLEQETGTGMGFTYEMVSEERAVFHIGDVMSSAPAEVSWLDTETVEIIWDDGGFETLKKLPNDPREPFHFYSNEVLRERALNVYQQKNGERPEYAVTYYNFDGTISIQLCDVMEGGYEVQCDRYVVDRYTGIGTNLMRERIDLSDNPVAEVPAVETTTAFPETTEMTETTTTMMPLQ